MADPKAHWDQGEHNRALSRELASQTPIRYKDWAVIAAFYGALQYVDAYLHSHYGPCLDSLRKLQETSHQFRIRMVTLDLPAIDASYRQLYRQSIALRYLEGNPCGIKGGFLSDSDVRSMVNVDLEDIRRVVSSRVNLCA